MALNLLLLTVKDIDTQEASKDSKHLNIITDKITINLSKDAIDELLIDLNNHKNKFGDNW